VAQVDVGSGGIDAELDAKGRVGFEGVFELRFQLGFGNDFGGAFFQVRELFFDGLEICGRHFLIWIGDSRWASLEL
jgi:hypothetical protein